MTHSTPAVRVKGPTGGVACAVAWILNAVLLTIVATGFAISTAAYSVATLSAMHDLFVGRGERLAEVVPLEGASRDWIHAHAEPR
jgi:hypothetical protein